MFDLFNNLYGSTTFAGPASNDYNNFNSNNLQYNYVISIIRTCFHEFIDGNKLNTMYVCRCGLFSSIKILCLCVE